MTIQHSFGPAIVALALASTTWLQGHPASAAAETRADCVAQPSTLERLLGARHGLPEHAVFERSCSRLEEALWQVVETPGKPIVYTLRALSVLGHAPSPASAEKLAHIAEDPAQRSSLRHYAAMAFFRHAPQDRAAQVHATLLADKDPALKLFALRLAPRFPTCAKSVQELERRADSTTLRKACRRALRRLKQAP